MKAIIVLAVLVAVCLGNTRTLFEIHEIPQERQQTVEETVQQQPAEKEKEPVVVPVPVEQVEEEPFEPTHRQQMEVTEIETVEEPTEKNSPSPQPTEQAQTETEPFEPVVIPDKQDNPTKPTKPHSHKERKHEKKDKKPYRVDVHPQQQQAQSVEPVDPVDQEGINEDSQHKGIFDGDNEFAIGLFYALAFVILVCLAIKRCIRVRTYEEYVPHVPQPVYIAGPREIQMNPYSRPQFPQEYMAQPPRYPHH